MRAWPEAIRRGGSQIAALTALVFAAICVLAWLLSLSSLVNFISETVLLGFKAGAAITIATTQLPKLLGVPGGGESFFERVAILAGQLGQTNLAVLGFGLAAIALLVAGERFLPGRPVALVVVALSIVLLSVTSLAELGFSDRRPASLRPAGAGPAGACASATSMASSRSPSRVSSWPTSRASRRPGRWRRRTATRSIRARSCSRWVRPTSPPPSGRATRSPAACPSRR